MKPLLTHPRPWRTLAALLWLALGAGCASLPPPADELPPLVVASPLPPAVPAEPIAEPTTVPAAEPVTLRQDPAPPAPPLARNRLDPLQDAERGDLWLRLRGGFAMADLDGDLVRKWERFYAGQPEYVERMTARASRYLFHVLEEVEKRQLPTELALLPFIESAFNPQAMSRARASGMWQFMPATGRDFELRQNVFRDDRRDVLASTRAALDYLQQLHAQFGDWPLALAAYNWGQGSVLKAQAKNRRAGRSTDYTSLRMPGETRNYVPKLQAIKNIVLHPQAFALALPPLENHPFFQTVEVDRDIDVALAARLAGLTLDEFQQLNPQMNKPVILAAGTPQLLLPYDSANRFVRELAAHRGALASWTAWVAPRTLKPAEAARLTGMDEDELREINAIPPRMLVSKGSTLIVPRAPHAQQDVSELLADHATMSLTPEARARQGRRYKAGRLGESVTAVARRLRVPAAELARWNGLSPKGRFAPQQTIIVQGKANATPARIAAKKPGRSALTKKVASKAAASRTAARKAKPAATQRTRVAASEQTERAQAR